MNDVHQPIPSIKMPTIRQRLPFGEVPSVHMIKLKRGLIQRSILYCFEKGYFSLIRYLLQSGAADTHERDNEGRTALMYCCFIESDCWAQNIAMTLLEYGANIQDQDLNGLNALHYAIITQRTILVRRYLTSLDFDLNRTVDIYGNTCLHYACSMGNLDIVRCILDAMKRYSVDLTIKNQFNLTALDIACQYHHERCQNLLRNEISLNERASKGSAKTNRSHSTINLLIERRSSIPARMNSITSATHHAESIVSVPIVISSVKEAPNHFSNKLISSRENIVSTPPILIDPIKSRHMTLKRNENLDLTLTNQIKTRAEFAARPYTSQNIALISSSTTWRDDFSQMFNQLQSYKTSSYRNTVHPPLSTELPSHMFDSGSEMFSVDGHDSYHQSQLSFRTNASLKVIHRRRNSATSASMTHKIKK